MLTEAQQYLHAGKENSGMSMCFRAFGLSRKNRAPVKQVPSEKATEKRFPPGGFALLTSVWYVNRAAGSKSSRGRNGRVEVGGGCWSFSCALGQDGVCAEGVQSVRNAFGRP